MNLGRNVTKRLKRYEKSFFDFVFKKHGNLNAQDKIEIKDDFVLLTYLYSLKRFV